ncbi:hypothetical protein [Paragemmobacter straminiformis]|uniref:Pilus assembly protein CpaE n=1 Tax=Paragemmobacter straminiformis TaxID=2045119 RepID=A0A842I8P2_9RHOB|nr:hypothetical protein [Gemmobacter straminiformis]MBC2835783.1 hypothetical protein [Gemmobacter straminiformis]
MTLHLADFTNPLPEVPEFASQPVGLLPPLNIAVFTETPAFAACVAGLGASRQFARVRMVVHEGGLKGALAAFVDAPAPQLLLIETDAAPQDLLEGLDALSEFCDPGTRLLLVGGDNDIALYRELIRRGVSDYLPRPVSVAGVLKSLADIASHHGVAAKGSLTAFVGASGGAGSSTVALNTAWLVGQAGHGMAGLIDLDLDFGTAGVSLALDASRGIAEALRAGANLDAQLLDGLFDSYDANLRVLAATDAAGLAQNPTTESVDHLSDLARSEGQSVMLDLPMIGNPLTRHALRSADRVVLTTTPDLAGLRNSRKMLDMIAEMRPDDPHPLVVLNKVGLSKRTEIGARDFAHTLGIALTATLPFDGKGFAHSTNLGRVHVATRAGRGAASALQPLVRALAGAGHPEKAAAKPLLQRLLHRG